MKTAEATRKIEDRNRYWTYANTQPTDADALAFASGDGHWAGDEGDWSDEDLPLFRNREAVAEAAAAGGAFDSNRLSFLKIAIYPAGTPRPPERDDAPQGRYTDAGWLSHRPYGWCEHPCRGGASWLHVILRGEKSGRHIECRIQF